MSLGEWVMRLPKFMLTHPQEDGKPLLYHVFASLYAASGSQFRPQKPEKVRCLFFYKVIWVGKFLLRVYILMYAIYVVKTHLSILFANS